MRKLKRSKCAILPLVLKGKWFDMIASGEKKIEYRRAGYWLDRVYNWFNKSIRGGLVPVVEFRHGYAKDARRMAFVCGWLWNRRERRFVYCTPPYAWLNRNWPIQHPELGETKIERVAILIGERITITEDGK